MIVDASEKAQVAVITTLLFIAILCSERGAFGQDYEGALRLGERDYAVIVQATLRAPTLMGMEIVLRRSGTPVASASAVFGSAGGVLTVDGRHHAIPPAVAQRWWYQFAEAHAPTAWTGFEMGAEAASSLRTRDVERLSPGVSGKAEIKVSSPCSQACGVERVRLFSLDEWNNSFRDRVSLGLERKEWAKEDRR